MTSPREPYEEVVGVPDFIAYLEGMAEDFDADKAEHERQSREGSQFPEEGWTSLYVGDFLRAWAAWLQDGRSATWSR